MFLSEIREGASMSREEEVGTPLAEIPAVSGDSAASSERPSPAHFGNDLGNGLADRSDLIECRAPTRGRVRPIRKITPDQRRRRIEVAAGTSWQRRVLLRLQGDSQLLRSTAQLAFALLVIWIGIEFYLFVQWGMSGGEKPFVERPPGVEGFLPISALMSLVYWLQTGIVNEIHPSGLVIFVAILAIGLLLKKAFCGWLCPVGTLSEALWMFGSRLFGRNLTVPRWLDYPLRSLKYLLLLFFMVSILQMDLTELQRFIYSPYNKMADVKMYLFFADISSFALWTIVILALLSVPIKNFWCRYLCPYGALLGAISWLSPLKITRTPSSCIDCELCTKACPSSIKVHTVRRVWSDECMACLRCVEACPVKNTLDLRTRSSRRGIPGWVFASLIIGVFVGVTGLAMLTGHWKNGISQEEYLRRFKNIQSPVYQHNRGSVPAYDGAD
jgi:ferredoxin